MRTTTFDNKSEHKREGKRKVPCVLAYHGMSAIETVEYGNKKERNESRKRKSGRKEKEKREKRTQRRAKCMSARA